MFRDNIIFLRNVILLIITSLFCENIYADGNIAPDNEKQRYESISNMSNKTLYDMGLFHVEERPDSALLYFDVLIHRYTPEMEYQDALLCANAMIKTAKILYNNFNYNREMEVLLKCRKVCDRYGFSDQLSIVYRMIGNIYSMHNDFDRSINFYQQALELAQKRKDSAQIHMVLSNLIGAQLFNGDINKADRYYTLMVSNKYDNIIYQYDLLIDGGLLSLFRERNREAITLLRQGAEYAITHNLDVTKIGSAYSWLAEGYQLIGNPDSTLYFLHKNERLAREAKQNDLLSETLQKLSLFYRERGDKTKAIMYLEEYLELSQKVFNQKKFNSLKNMQFQYELDKSEDIIRDLNEQRIRQEASMRVQRTILWAVFIGLLVSLIFFIIILKQNSRLTTAYNDLYKHNRINIANEKQSRERIKELEKRISTLMQNNDQVVENSIEEATTDKNESIKETSEISRQLKEKLHRDIATIMDNAEIFCDPTFTINRLAEEVHSNTTYVSKFINETYGMNFRTFLSEYRIKESMQRLSEKEGEYANLTIKAIGESVGFKSQSAYIAAFTKFTGMKPSTYQSIARKDTN